MRFWFQGVVEPFTTEAQREIEKVLIDLFYDHIDHVSVFVIWENKTNSIWCIQF